MPLAVEHRVVERSCRSGGCSTWFHIGGNFWIAYDLDTGIEFDYIYSGYVKRGAGLGYAFAFIVLNLVPKVKSIFAHTLLESTSVLEETTHTDYAVPGNTLHFCYIHIAGCIRC